MKYTLKREGQGRMYVLGSFTLVDEPILRTLWWLVDHATRDPYRPIPSWDEIEREPLISTRGHNEDFMEPKSGMRFWLLGGGRAEAVKVMDEPILPPKTRLGIRWHNGAWERLTKRHGWTV